MKFKKRFKKPPVIRFVPNAVTVLALCSGLSSIQFALTGRWEASVGAILLAALLDGMDGRIARWLGQTSEFGAELDSLADFISFGVAPALVIYLHVLQNIKGFGWSLVLFFSTCQALRLARFNVSRTGERPAWALNFSTGVPAPAGAFLSLMPLIYSFAFEETVKAPWFVLSLIIAAILMVSRIPTFVVKKLSLPPHLAGPALVGVALVISTFFSAPWLVLFVLGLFYIGSIPMSALMYKRRQSEA